VHLFRDELKHQSAKSGAEIAVLAGASTQHCHACGHRNSGVPDRSARIWTCTNCGATWDQDENAARNLYDAATGASTDVLRKVA
jgi:transposase